MRGLSLLAPHQTKKGQPMTTAQETFNKMKDFRESLVLYLKDGGINDQILLMTLAYQQAKTEVLQEQIDFYKQSLQRQGKTEELVANENV
jgi:hypothetical protein